MEYLRKYLIKDVQGPMSYHFEYYCTGKTGPSAARLHYLFAPTTRLHDYNKEGILQFFTSVVLNII